MSLVFLGDQLDFTEWSRMWLALAALEGIKEGHGFGWHNGQTWRYMGSTVDDAGCRHAFRHHCHPVTGAWETRWIDAPSGFVPLGRNHLPPKRVTRLNTSEWPFKSVSLSNTFSNAPVCRWCCGTGCDSCAHSGIEPDEDASSCGECGATLQYHEADCDVCGAVDCGVRPENFDELRLRRVHQHAQWALWRLSLNVNGAFDWVRDDLEDAFLALEVKLLHGVGDDS
jgi:hypothetical protein